MNDLRTRDEISKTIEPFKRVRIVSDGLGHSPETRIIFLGEGGEELTDIPCTRAEIEVPASGPVLVRLTVLCAVVDVVGDLDVNFQEVKVAPSPEEAELQKGIIREALDTLAGALTDQGHTWTPQERRLYERALRRLQGG